MYFWNAYNNRVDVFGWGKRPRIWGFHTIYKNCVEKKCRIFFIFHIFFDDFELKILKNMIFAWFCLTFLIFKQNRDFSEFYVQNQRKKYGKWKKSETFFRQDFCILYENLISGVVFPNRIRLHHYYKHFGNSFSRFPTIILKDLLIRIRDIKSCLAGKLL